MEIREHGPAAPARGMDGGPGFVPAPITAPDGTPKCLFDAHAHINEESFTEEDRQALAAEIEAKVRERLFAPKEITAEEASAGVNERPSSAGKGRTPA